MMRVRQLRYAEQSINALICEKVNARSRCVCASPSHLELAFGPLLGAALRREATLMVLVLGFLTGRAGRSLRVAVMRADGGREMVGRVVAELLALTVGARMVP